MGGWHSILFGKVPTAGLGYAIPGHDSLTGFKMKSTLALAYVLSSVLITLTTISLGAEAKAPLAPVKALTPFAEKHCITCHDKDEQKGGFDMEDLLKSPSVEKNPAAWLSVLERIVSRDMPPKKRKERPTEAEYQQSENWLRSQIEAYEAFAATQRPRPMRRLNSDEYNRSIQEVFGIPGIKPAADFPPDDAFEGFTNIGEALNLSTVLIEQYLSAGRKVAHFAVVEGQQPASKRRVFTHASTPRGKAKPADYATDIRGHDPGGAVNKVGWVGDHLFVDGGNTPAGTYSVRLHATPKNLAGRPTYIPNFQYLVNDVRVYQGDVPIQEGVPMKQEFHVMDLSGRLKVDFRWVNGFPDNNDLRGQGLRLPEWSDKEAHNRKEVWNYLRYVWEPQVKADPATPYPFPYFDDFYLELEGPLYPDGWPLSRFQRENAAAIVAKDAKRIAQWLLPKLYRRPATENDIAEFAAFVEQSEKALADAKPTPPPIERRFPEALRLGIQQALISPHFLFIVEPGPVGRPLTDPELATRLAYFLWSAPPDAELAKLATEGQLRPALAAQTKRMLADPRSAAFLDRFTQEWLGLAKLSTIMPEISLFRRFDKQGILSQEMAAEPRAMLGYLLQENASLYDLLDANYAFINDRLADFYHLPSLWSIFPMKRDGFDPISGGDMRKVTLPDKRRGGLVGMAGVLALTSENTRTSAVRRGVWILEKIFNRTPPPPPPNVNGVLPPTSEGTTAVEKIKLHRNAPNCAGCHQRIDPLGVALENYDTIGEWRDTEPPWIDPANPTSTLEAVRAKLKLKQYDPLPTFPIDLSFSMGGVEGQGVEALKQYLVANKERFARGFTEKLATYAMGRKNMLTDDTEIKKIQDAAMQDNFRFQTLLLALVQSKMFQTH